MTQNTCFLLTSCLCGSHHTQKHMLASFLKKSASANLSHSVALSICFQVTSLILDFNHSCQCSLHLYCICTPICLVSCLYDLTVTHLSYFFFCPPFLMTLSIVSCHLYVINSQDGKSLLLLQRSVQHEPQSVTRENLQFHSRE